ncbi:proteasome-interacting protein cic1 [Diplodia seriata]
MREELPAPQIKKEPDERKNSSASASSEGSRGSDVKIKKQKRNSVADEDWGEFFGDGVKAENNGDEDLVMKDEPTMAKSSDAPATKCELVLSYQLDSAQALRAAKPLTAHIKSSESTKAAASTKKNLLEDESSEDDDVAADG